MNSLKLVMASLVSTLVACLFLLPLFGQALPLDSNGGKPKAFEFLQHLQGCKKGDTIKGLNELKQYLQNFGYLNHHQSNINHIHAHNDSFDDTLESAIKTYQLNFNLKATGILDSETVRKMMMPRCGVPDIVNGTTSMRSATMNHYFHRSTNLHIGSHFAFFSGTPRWDNSTTHLTYVFVAGTQTDILSPICARAFGRWASVSRFTFEEIQDYILADLIIGFYKGDHGDGYPFDGPGGTVAHSYMPKDGRFHYDADEKWSDGPVAGSMDLETVALHEIGHLLGLAHSSVEEAIMFPNVPVGAKKDLHTDDIQGIQTLYSL